MIHIVLAAVLTAPVLPAFAAPAPKGPHKLTALELKGLEGLDRQLKDLTAAGDKAQSCFDQEAPFQRDYAGKEAELKKEFNGVVPLAYSDLLWRKKARIDKQHAACVALHVQFGRAAEEMENAFRNIEPKSMDVRRQRSALDAQKDRFKKMMPAKGAGKAAKPAATDE